MAMSGSTVGSGGRFTRKDDGAPREAAMNWQAIEGSPEFQELVKARRSFLVPATILFLVFSLGYLLLAAFVHGFMGKQVFGGIPVAFLAALTQVLLTWAITWAYLRRADNTFGPLERRAAEAAPRVAERSAR
jgi:uncharacterized membrane protein (DUF485 family)